MLFKLSTVFALVATLASLHQSEAIEMGIPGIAYPGVLTIAPSYQTKNIPDTFAQACASNTFQSRIATTSVGRTSVVVCDIDLEKINEEQYCALTNASEFFGLQCGTAVVKVDADAVGVKRVLATIEADFTGTIFPPKVTGCAKVKVARKPRKLAKRWNVVKTFILPPFNCPAV